MSSWEVEEYIDDAVSCVSKLYLRNNNDPMVKLS